MRILIYGLLMILPVLAHATDGSNLEYGELTPLHRAIVEDGEDQALAILKAHPELADEPIQKYSTNIANQSNWTPLLLAAHRAYPRLVTELLKKGARVNFQDARFNYTPLFILVAFGNNKPPADVEKTVSILIKAGADVNLTTSRFNSSETSPLILANDRYIDSRLFNLLLSAGADANAKLPTRPIHAVTYLPHCLDIGDDTLAVTCVSERMDRLKALIQRGADVNVVDATFGNSPLMNVIGHLAMQGYSDRFAFQVSALALEGVKTLIAAGAKVCDRYTQFNATPLEFAKRFEKRERFPATAAEAISILEKATITQGCR
jgi:hypothetical protein